MKSNNSEVCVLNIPLFELEERTVLPLNTDIFAGSQVLMTVVRRVFGDRTHCTHLKLNRCMEETCFLAQIAVCLMLVSYLVYSLTLKMETKYSSEKLAVC